MLGCTLRHCPVCNKKKHPTKKQTAPLVDYRSGYPLDRIGLDIIGPLPQTKRRNKYLLVVGDYFTRWMEAYHISQQNAEMIADKLVNEFISRFGVPLEVHTDQGRHFDGKHFCRNLQVVRNDENQDNCISPCIKRDDREIQQNTWQYDKEFRKCKCQQLGSLCKSFTSSLSKQPTSCDRIHFESDDAKEGNQHSQEYPAFRMQHQRTRRHR